MILFQIIFIFYVKNRRLNYVNSQTEDAIVLQVLSVIKKIKQPTLEFTRIPANLLLISSCAKPFAYFSRVGFISVWPDKEQIPQYGEYL